MSRVKKKAEPAVNVGCNVGDTLMARWYHEDSLGSPFRGAYYVAQVIDVFTNTRGRKTYTVQYCADVIEENVKHNHTKSLEK